MKRFETQGLGRMLSVAVGLVILIGSQPSFGQSVPSPPKKSPAIIEMEGMIQENMNLKKQIEESIVKSSNQSSLLSTELESLRKLERNMNVSAESYPEVLKTLHSQRVQLLIDLAGIDARFAAIENAIAQITKKQSESVMDPMKKLVEIRQSEIDRLKTAYETGVIGESSLRDAEIALLEAKTRLAQINSTSGGLLGQLNAQLLDTSLEKAEKTARLDKTKSLIGDVDEFRTHASEVGEKQQELKDLAVRSRLQQNQLEAIKKKISAYEKQLEVLTAAGQ